MGRERPAHNSRVLGVERRQGPMTLGGPEGDPVRAVLASMDEISHEMTMGRERTMGDDQKRRIVPVMSKPQHLLRQPIRCFQVGPGEGERPEALEDGSELRGLSELLTQF